MTKKKAGDCHADKDENTCDNDSGCTWCACRAVPSACYTDDEAKALPSAVFNCDPMTRHTKPLANPFHMHGLKDDEEECNANKA